MTFVWILLAIVGVVLGLGAGAFILLWVNAVRASGQVVSTLDAMVEPVLQSVRENRDTAPGEVVLMASVPAPRNHLYAKLKEMGKVDLFPAEFRAVDKIAESDLVRWLMHRNELAAMPTEIELVRQVPVQEGDKQGAVFLFRFRTEPPHWAADRGWMAGTSGPYWDGEANPGESARAFSELVPFAAMTEEEHIALLKAAIGRMGLVVPS